MRARLLLLSVLVAGFSAASEPVDVIRQYVIEKAKSEPKPRVLVKRGADFATAALLTADEKGIVVNTDGAEVRLQWTKLSKEEVYQLFSPLVDSAPAEVHETYLLLAHRLQHTDSFARLLADLWRKAPDAAKRVEAAVASASPPATLAAGQRRDSGGGTVSSNDAQACLRAQISTTAGGLFHRVEGNLLQNSSFEHNWYRRDFARRRRFLLLHESDIGLCESDGHLDHWFFSKGTPAEECWDSRVGRTGGRSVHFTKPGRVAQQLRFCASADGACLRDRIDCRSGSGPIAGVLLRNNGCPS
jgi:hypothetical protein